MREGFPGEEAVEMSERGEGPGDGWIIEGGNLRVRAALGLVFGCLRVR